MKQNSAAHTRLRASWLFAVAPVLLFTATTTSSSSFTPIREDPRFPRLERFFQRYNCPVPHYVNAYIRAADIYDLDYRLLPAVSVRETQCGVHEFQNNRWGYNPGHPGLPSIADGIDFVARQLAQSPTYAGRSLRQKLFIYNPRPAYPIEVLQIMRQIQ